MLFFGVVNIIKCKIQTQSKVIVTAIAIAVAIAVAEAIAIVSNSTSTRSSNSKLIQSIHSLFFIHPSIQEKLKVTLIDVSMWRTSFSRLKD